MARRPDAVHLTSVVAALRLVWIAPVEVEVSGEWTDFMVLISDPLTKKSRICHARLE